MKKYEHYPFMRQRKNGVWYAHIIWEDGARDILSLKERNKVRAEAKFRQLQEKIHAKIIGVPRIPTALPFPQSADRYLAEGTFNLQVGSRDRSRLAVEKHLKPFFGKESLTRIGPQRVLDYITARLRVRAAPNTIHKEIAALSAIFRFYVQREILPGNPVLAVDKPKIKVIRPNYAPSISEVMKILDHISPYERRFFLFLWSTGARFSEVRRANIGDVDFQAQTITLTRKGGKIQTIGLNNLANQVVCEEISKRGIPNKDEPLFLNRQNKRCGRIDEVLLHACQKAGVPHVTHHGLRHSFARTLRRAGHSLETISKLLGHKSTYVTQTIYTDFRDDEVIEEAKRVELPIQKVIKK